MLEDKSLDSEAAQSHLNLLHSFTHLHTVWCVIATYLKEIQIPYVLYVCCEDLVGLECVSVMLFFYAP